MGHHFPEKRLLIGLMERRQNAAPRFAAAPTLPPGPACCNGLAGGKGSQDALSACNKAGIDALLSR